MVFRYLLVYRDHGVKWVDLRPLSSKTHVAIANALYSIFCNLGVPLILQCDNALEHRGMASARNNNRGTSPCCFLAFLLTSLHDYLLTNILTVLVAFAAWTCLDACHVTK